MPSPILRGWNIEQNRAKAFNDLLSGRRDRHVSKVAPC